MEATWQFIRLSRPLYLIGVAVIYALGGGIAHYLGAIIRWDLYWLGQLWVSLLQLAVVYLAQYFDPLADLARLGRPVLAEETGERWLPRRTAMAAALTCLALLASFTAVLLTRFRLPAEGYLLMGLGFAGAFFYAVPPLRLKETGYGELALAVLAGLLAPAFAFVLQEGALHRLVAMSAFPLVALILAMCLAFELRSYLVDLRLGRRTLLVRLGWENGMLLHNLLVLAAFLLLVIARSLGYPWFAALAGLLAFPVGVFQIWQIQRIGAGNKPNWNLLTTGALSLVGLQAYLVALAFWTN